MLKTNDPQTIVKGFVTEVEEGEAINFTVNLGLFEVACKVHIPEEGKTVAPVHINDKMVVDGHLKDARGGGEIITFTVRFGLFEMVAIANIPESGQTQAPVYIKYKVVREYQRSRSTRSDQAAE